MMQTLINRYKQIVILFWTCLTLCLIQNTFAASVDMKVSSEEINIDEPLTITYTIHGNINQRPDFSPLEQDFHIINTNYRNSLRMINGTTSINSFWQVQVLPRRNGVLWLPVISFGNIQSTPRKINVITNKIYSQPSPAIHNNVQQNNSVFVTGEVTPSSPYVESQLIYRFKVFTRSPLRNPSLQLPSFAASSFLPLEDRPSYQTSIHGQIYNVIEKRFALFIKKPGKVEIPALQFRAELLKETNPYDDLFNFPEIQPIALATKPIALSVRDIPSSYQANPWLPAEKISLTESWSPSNNWETGNPITRTIRIKAEGLRSDQIPDITIEKIPGINVYVDQPKRSNSLQENNVVGILEQKVTYIPNQAQTIVIPRITLNWWNIKTNENVVSQLNEKSLIIKAAPSSSSNSTNLGALPNAVNSKALNVNSNVNSNLDGNSHIQDANSSSQPVNSGANINSGTNLDASRNLNSDTRLHPSTKISDGWKDSFYQSLWFWISCFLLITWLMTFWFLLRKRNPPTASLPSGNTNKLTEKDFEQACHQGEAALAQQFLLHWAKTIWPNAQPNLADLRKLNNDESFHSALNTLEQAIYAKKPVKWQGELLLSSFAKLKKNHHAQRYSAKTYDANDLLPPLNPQ